MKEILTSKEAALYLNVHVRTIYNLAKNGRIPGRKLGGSWRFNKAILDEWLSGRMGERKEGRELMPLTIKLSPLPSHKGRAAF
ncbi:MAG TPA: helix-turn-helix domain-containing protein [Thermodesulfobacteriota bacterium]|jgi:excisionase family DNA binding protein|nr:helix-turn-helix domain-containing protein [Thermodesulfobacteriota bacterium]